MTEYEKIPCNRFVNKNGTTYRVKQYGFGGVVYYEELIPLPDTKTTTVFNADGSENKDLSTTTPIEKK